MPFSVVLGFASLAAVPASSSSFLLIKARNGLLETEDGVELVAAPDDDSLTGDVASLAESEAADSSVVEPTWNVAGRKKLFGAVGVVEDEEDDADPVPESRDEGRNMFKVRITQLSKKRRLK